MAAAVAAPADHASSMVLSALDIAEAPLPGRTCAYMLELRAVGGGPAPLPPSVTAAVQAANQALRERVVLGCCGIAVGTFLSIAAMIAGVPAAVAIITAIR